MRAWYDGCLWTAEQVVEALEDVFTELHRWGYLHAGMLKKLNGEWSIDGMDPYDWCEAMELD